MTGDGASSQVGSPKADSVWDAFGLGRDAFGMGTSGLDTAGLANLTSRKMETKISGHEDKNRAARCLDSILTTNGHFVGRNVTNYLRTYESKMKVNLVDSRLALESFITLVGESLFSVVMDLVIRSEGDWTDFTSRMKKEFFAEDADRMTRTSFMSWVQDRSKTLGPMELLREFELKFKLLPVRDMKSIGFIKVETFLDAAGPRMRREINTALDLFHPGRDEEETVWEDLLKAIKQVEACRRRDDREDETNREMQTLISEVRRLQGKVSERPQSVPVPVASPSPTINVTLPPSAPEYKPRGIPVAEGNRNFRCMWCDSLDHERKECESFKKYFRDEVVKFVDRKLAYSDTGELIPTNFGKGGMKEIVDKRIKGKAASTSSYTYEPCVQVQAVKVSQSEGTMKTKSNEVRLDEEGQLALAEHIQGESGWDCPVFISTTTAEKWGEWASEGRAQVWATGEGPTKGKEKEVGEGTSKTSEPKESPVVEGSDAKKEEKTMTRKEKGKGKPFVLGRGIDAQFDKTKVSKVFWSQELRGLTIGDFFGSIRKDVQEEILEKLKRKRMVKGEGGAIVGAVFITEDGEEGEIADWDEAIPPEECKVSEPVYKAYVRALERWTPRPGEDRNTCSFQGQANQEVSVEEMCWARGCTMCEIEMRGVLGLVPALLDSGSEVNLMSLAVYKAGGWPVDRKCGWEVNSVNDTGQGLWGACARVMVRVGNLVEPINIFVHSTLPHSVILGQPFITELRMETKVLNDGTHVAKIKSRDGNLEVQFPTVRPGNVRNKTQLRGLPAASEDKEDF